MLFYPSPRHRETILAPLQRFAPEAKDPFISPIFWFLEDDYHPVKRSNQSGISQLFRPPFGSIEITVGESILNSK
jgi:hypothetical protein